MFDYDTNTGQIRAYGEVGFPDEGFTETDFMEALDAMGGRDVEIKLQSPGGDIFPGLSIMNQIEDYTGGITVVIDSMAASIASVFPLAADRVIAHANSRLMVHNPWTIVLGEAGELRAAADVLDQLADGIAADYERYTNRSKAFWSKEMAKTTYYSAEEALKVGLVDEVRGQNREKPRNVAADAPRPRLARLQAVKVKLDLIRKTLDA